MDYNHLEYEYRGMSAEELIKFHAVAVEAKYFFINSAKKSILRHNLLYAQMCRFQAFGWYKRICWIEHVFDGSVSDENVIKRLNEQEGELSNYERIVTEYSATLANQHDKIEWLQAQLDAANAAFGHTVEDESSGKEYAEGCKP